VKKKHAGDEDCQGSVKERKPIMPKLGMQTRHKIGFER